VGHVLEDLDELDQKIGDADFLEESSNDAAEGGENLIEPGILESSPSARGSS